VGAAVTRLAYIDVVGGAAGDMLMAALLDAGASEAAVRGAVEAVLPGAFVWRTEEVRRGGLRGRRLVTEPGPSGGSASRSRGSRPLADLVTAVRGAELRTSIAVGAERALEALGRAEATVHGVPSSQVEVHELGDDDTLLDVVGVVAALDALGVERVVVSSLPLAFDGTSSGAEGHPEIPLPAPVSLELLRGFDIRPARGPGEWITPTAAALIATLAEPGPHVPELTLEAVGYGAGTRDPDDVPNLVRVLVGSTPAPAATPADRSLVVLEANIDDLSAELLADAGDALLAAGALDVWTTPVVMKKGRPAVVLSALCETTAASAVRRAFFLETPTLGVRASVVSRTELDRRIETVEVAGSTVRVKVAFLDGRVITAKPEHDDVLALAAASGRPVREIADLAAAAARDVVRERVP